MRFWVVMVIGLATFGGTVVYLENNKAVDVTATKLSRSLAACQRKHEEQKHQLICEVEVMGHGYIGQNPGPWNAYTRHVVDLIERVEKLEGEQR